MSVAAEETRIKNTFEHIETIEEVADTFDEDDDRRAKLLNAARQALATVGPVRASVAARLLELSEPTVRAWARQGVLTPAQIEAKRLLLDPHRIHDVLHLVRDLRAIGQDRNLLEAVWYKLSDRALLERDDLRASLEQMGRSQGTDFDPDELD
ncbi:hypothetical protein ABZ671_25285 [Micromonospora sp. NPDC006766]|jgi:hypothetical protein|uniref:hypothetical protein n=1 Tax=Micromonospora sp. NPDC006766 TaxID=3154778 RepID=UPI0033CD6BFB